MKNILKIGISYTDFRFNEYLDYLKSSEYNVDIVVLDYSKNNFEDLLNCDGLVLSGGKDINPELYGKGNEVFKCGKLIPERDSFELKLIEIAFDKKIPIFGICRGHQIVNISNRFKGSLHCDINSIGTGNYLSHSNNTEEGVRHNIEIVKGTILEKIIGKNVISVNSFHHQAVDKIGAGLRVSSYSPDGIIESLEWENGNNAPFLLLVQWHPERLLNEESSKLLINYYYNQIIKLEKK